jgi:hypothetical protein
MTGDRHVRSLWEPAGEIPPGHPAVPSGRPLTVIFHGKIRRLSGDGPNSTQSAVVWRRLDLLDGAGWVPVIRPGLSWPPTEG